MRKVYACLILAALACILASCNDDAGARWTARILDTDGKPIKGATMFVWAYAVDGSPRAAEELTAAFAAGRTLTGWKYTANDKGKVTCKDIPTGGEVIDSYQPSQVVVTTQRTSGNATAYGTSGGSVHAYGNGTTTTTTRIPAQVMSHYEPGRWLAVTICAQGYEPATLTFCPNTPRGDLGKIQLQRKY